MYLITVVWLKCFFTYFSRWKSLQNMEMKFQCPYGCGSMKEVRGKAFVLLYYKQSNESLAVLLLAMRYFFGSSIFYFNMVSEWKSLQDKFFWRTAIFLKVILFFLVIYLRYFSFYFFVFEAQSRLATK